MRRSLSAVYRDPIFQALNPVDKQFVEVRWLPPRLNPFSEAHVAMAGLIPFMTFPHIKTVPALQMMLEDFKCGRYKRKHTIVVDSSGNTAHAVARLAPAFGFRHIKVVLATDVPESKKGILAALASVEIIEVGGGMSVAARARKEARQFGHYHLDQYSHRGNVHAHELYTGPAIERPFLRVPRIIAVALGSGGTAAGVGRFFHKRYPDTIIIGVRPVLGQQVPGARDAKRMAEVVRLPWRKAVDEVVEVTRKASFIGMRELWSAVEPQPGPTSGMAYRGLLQYLQGLTKKELGSLKGSIASFICPDDGRFYSERTTGELDPQQGL